MKKVLGTKKVRDIEHNIPDELGWCFAIINGRLAELHFDTKTKKPWAHCYVKEEEYTTKKEKRYIEEDTKKARFSYRNGKYAPVQKNI